MNVHVLKHLPCRVAGFALALLLVAIATVPAAARVRAFRDEVPNSYDFWLYEPEYADSLDAGAANYNYRNKLPLLLFLHGQSLCGNDLNRVRRYGSIAAVEMGRVIDAYVVAPQCNTAGWRPERLKAIVDWAIKNYNVDPDRVCVMGMSLGGFGTLDFCARYPDVVSAAMALCGGATAKDLSGLNSVPLWIIHGTADRAVPIAQSRRVVTAMKAAGPVPLLRYDEWPGVNHGQLARLLYMQETYDWLLSHSRADKPRTVNTWVDILPEFMREAYSNMDKSSASANRRGLSSRSATKSKSVARAKSRSKSKRSSARSRRGRR